MRMWSRATIGRPAPFLGLLAGPKPSIMTPAVGQQPDPGSQKGDSMSDRWEVLYGSKGQGFKWYRPGAPSLEVLLWEEIVLSKDWTTLERPERDALFDERARQRLQGDGWDSAVMILLSDGWEPFAFGAESCALRRRYVDG
jgi:hypothetical protein